MKSSGRTVIFHKVELIGGPSRGMELNVILSAVLGLSEPWQITDIIFSNNYRRLDINIDYVRDEAPVCPHCGYRNSCVEKELCSWYNNDFLSYETYLHTRSPRMTCCEDGTTIIPPWLKQGSKFIPV